MDIEPESTGKPDNEIFTIVIEASGAARDAIAQVFGKFMNNLSGLLNTIEIGFLALAVIQINSLRITLLK